MLDLYDYDADESTFGLLKKFKLGLFLGAFATATSAFVALSSSNINRDKISYNLEAINRDFRNQFFAIDYVRADDSYKQTFDKKRQFRIRGADADYFGYNFNDTSAVQASELAIQQDFLNQLIAMPNGKKQVYVSSKAVPTGYLDRAREKPYYYNLDPTTGYTDSIAQYYLGTRRDASGNAFNVPYATQSEAIDSISTSTGAIEYKGRVAADIGTAIDNGMVGEIVDVDGYTISEKKTYFWNAGVRYTLSDGARVNLVPDTTAFESVQDAIDAGRASQVALETLKIRNNPTYNAIRDWEGDRYNDATGTLGYDTKYQAYVNATRIPAIGYQNQTWGAGMDANGYNGANNWDNTTINTWWGSTNRGTNTFLPTALADSNSPTWQLTFAGGATEANRAGAENGALGWMLRQGMQGFMISYRCGVKDHYYTQNMNNWKQWNTRLRVQRYLIDPSDRTDWYDIDSWACVGLNHGDQPNFGPFFEILQGKKFSDGKSFYDKYFWDGNNLPAIEKTKEEYRATATYSDDYRLWSTHADQTSRVEWNNVIYDSANDPLLTAAIRNDGVLRINYDEDDDAPILTFDDKFFVDNFAVTGHALDPTTDYDTLALAQAALRNAIINWKPWIDSRLYTSLPGNPYAINENNVSYQAFVGAMQGSTVYQSSIKTSSSDLLQVFPTIEWDDMAEFGSIRITKFEKYNGTNIDYYFPGIDAIVARTLLENVYEGVGISSEWITDETTGKWYLESDSAIGSGNGIYFETIAEVKKYWEDYLTGQPDWQVPPEYISPDVQTTGRREY